MEILLSLVCWTSLIKHPTLGCQCSFVHSTNALEGTHRDDSRDPAFGPGVRRWVRGSDALSGAPVGVGRVASTGANKHSCLLGHRAKQDTEAERRCSKRLAKQGKQQVQMLWTQRVSYSGGVHQDSDPNSELSNCVYFTMLRFYILTFHDTPYNFYKRKNRSGRKNFTPLSFSILLDLNLLQ